jgi:deoxyribose-phosphate aldolase
MENIFDRYNKKLDLSLIEREISNLQEESKQHFNADRLKRILSCVDLTTLNTEDNENVVLDICRKLNGFSSAYSNIPGVAAICVFPSLVETVKKELFCGINIASVAGGFPSSQTFPDVKRLEARLATEAGANEIDIVMQVGSFLAGDFIGVAGGIVEIKKSIGDAHLKVILETGILGPPENIRKASILAMQAGADFIKTSTGKISPAATFQAVYIMADAAGDYYRKTGRKVGIKAAGGIVVPEDALIYCLIIEKLLGKEWAQPTLFRIGASRLVNNLLNAIRKLETGKESLETYF